ncbi:MAG: NADH-quinone oxidoreductase subunit NuoE [Aquabacterium sp.]|nr:NADH-quinone oxidoreductase subunit NuoE [Aquabacterium sp.]
MKHLIPEFDQMRRRFPAEATSSMVLPCLRRIQDDRGFVADSDIAELTAYLGVPRIQIEEVLAHYTQFRRAPIGRSHLQVCRNLSCSMRGAEGVIEHLCHKLQLQPGQTTADGRFTLSTVECLGSCGTAPVVMVNEAYHENMSPAKLDALIEELGK